MIVVNKKEDEQEEDEEEEEESVDCLNPAYYPKLIHTVRVKPGERPITQFLHTTPGPHPILPEEEVFRILFKQQANDYKRQVNSLQKLKLEIRKRQEKEQSSFLSIFKNKYL